MGLRPGQEMIRDISLRALLILSFLLSGLIPVMVLSLISLNSSKTLLQDEAFSQLEMIRNIKKVQITDYFKERLSDIIVLSENPFIRSAYEDIRSAFYSSGGVGGKNFAGHKNEDFKSPEVYLKVHNKYFKTLKNITSHYRYYDLFLMDPLNGDTVFTVKKESDFGMRIGDVDSSLKDVWQQVMKTVRPALSDTRPYSPSGDSPAQFLAAPIMDMDGSGITGVIAVQISIDSVGEIMKLSTGMWQSGDSYLVGSDRKMRSDSHNDSSGHSVLSSFHGTVKENGVDTVASHSALSGKTGKMIDRNFQSREVLSAFAPLNIMGVNWAILAEVEKNEIDDHISQMLNHKIIFLFLTSLALVVIFATIVSLFLYSSINGTIHQIDLLIKKVLKGDMKPRINPDMVAADLRGVVRSSNQLIDALEGERAEKERLEEHLQSSRKLRSIGALAGGIAHDFNNLLTNMYTNCHIIKENAELNENASESFDEMKRSINAAAELVKQILTFSNSSISRKTEVNIPGVIREVLVLLKGNIPDNVSIHTEFNDPGLSTFGTQSQIGQVFLNLIINGCHAIGSDAGSIHIRADKVTLPEGESRSASDYCRIRIEDSGTGISPEVMENIFEPFYSTKPSDEGSGLGLSIVHGIVMNSGGMIDVKSTPGEGTVFTLDLPLFYQKPINEFNEVETGSDSKSIRLLLVDDDPEVCRYSSKLISDMGINVSCAGDGREVFKLFKKDIMKFNVVLTDFDMPNMNGIELQKKLNKMRKDLPVVLCTGLKNIRWIREKYDISGCRAIILKPYTPEKLEEVIRSVIKP